MRKPVRDSILGFATFVAMATRVGRASCMPLLALILALGLRAEPAEATVSIQPADTIVTVGHEIVVRAVTDFVADLKAFELIYRYDNTRLQFLGATAGEMVTSAGLHVGFVVPDVPPADSVIYDAAVLQGSASGSGVLVYLRFRALAVGEAMIECQLADFRDSQNQQTFPPCEDARVVVVAPTAAVPIVPDRFSMAAPLPNPLHGAGRGIFRFSMPRTGTVQLDLLDATGRRVAQRSAESFSAGVHSIDLQTHGLPAGLYFARMSTGWGESQLKRWIVLK